MISKLWAVIPISNSITNGSQHRTVIFLPMHSYITIFKAVSMAAWGWNPIKKKKKQSRFWGVLIITGMTYSCLQDLYAMKVTLSLVKIINGDFSRQHRLLGVCPNCRCLKTVLPLTI